MKKLTLINITVQGCRINTFVYLPYKNGKPFLAWSTLDELHRRRTGKDVTRNKTISVG